MFKSIEIKKIELTLQHVKSGTVNFNCGGVLEGTIQTILGLGYQISLEGGYKLTEVHCPVCAAEAITDIYLELEHCDERAGLNYQTYKEVFRSGVNSILHH